MSLVDITKSVPVNAGVERIGAKVGGNVLSSRMTHSLSTPSGVDGTVATIGHRGGKKLTVRIQMLDDSVTMFQVQAKALGKVLFEQVCRQLNLLEADYFGLEYQEISTHTKYWLDLEKPLNRQVGFSLIDPVLRFCVKFYTPDPSQLEEEYTRYLFCLQIKRDLASGSLQCNDNTAALMASYIVQASCGDFVPEDYPDHTYLSSYRFVPHQDDSMQRKIMENHKKHVGQSPAEADINLLETARRCELYGMKMHPAKDVEGVPLNLAVAHMGITVFQNITRINTFSWAKIRKISFKRKRFLIKLHPEGYGYYKDTVEFYFEGRNECKNFWKKCVENHGFFRCAAVQNQPRRKSRVLSRGSSFRYSGKTQKQMIEFVRENYVKRQTFQRSQSFRVGPFSSSSRSQSHTYVNSSISANPLLPINTADWDCRNLRSGSTTPSAKRKGADTLDRHQNNPTDSSSTQVTAAQVEIYATKNCTTDSQNLEMANLAKTNLNHPGLVQDPQSQTSPTQINLSVNALDQDHIHQNNHNFGLNRMNHVYSNNTPRALADYQAYAPVLPQQLLCSNLNTNGTVTHLVDHSSRSIRLEDQEEETSSDLTTSTIRRENLALTLETQMQLQQHQPKLPMQESSSQTATPIHYSSTKYSMSKRCTNNNSTETETDNVIYTDINLNRHSKVQTSSQIENKILNRENHNLNDNSNDIYATINHKTKLKSRDKMFSDEYINRAQFSQYVQTKRRNVETMPHKHQQQSKYNSSNCTALPIRYHNDLDHPSDSSSFFSFLTKSNQESATSCERLLNFDNFITQSIDSNSGRSDYVPPRNTQSLPRKSDFFGVDSVDSYDSHYITHHSFANMCNYDAGDRHNTLAVSTFVEPRRSSMPNSNSTKKRAHVELVEYDISSGSYLPSTISQPYEENIYDQVQKEPWLKSSSCKELNDFSPTFFDADHMLVERLVTDKNYLSLNRIDSPVTRYDDSNQASYVQRKKSPTFRKLFLPLSISRNYSYSYPGSTFSAQELQYRRRCSHHLDNTGSQDDVSHDSYELLEKNVHEYIGERSRSEENLHSCSMDSGNYIPSEDDDDSASEHQRYRSAMDVNCKSAADIMNEIWNSAEDPRYLPREKMCVKSDGSFYKKIKDACSNASSQESKKSHDSLYYTDSKKSRDTTSSPEMKESSIFVDYIGKNYEMPTTTEKKLKLFKKEQCDLIHENVSNTTSSRSEYYYDTAEGIDQKYYERPKVKSHDCLLSEKPNIIEESFVYENRDIYLTFPSNRTHKTSKVHSISLQNVEIEKNTKCIGLKSPNSAPSFVKNNRQNKEIQTNDSSIDKTISLEDADIAYHDIYQFRNRSGSTNIFTFDQQHIEDIQKFSKEDKKKQSPDYPLTPELISEFEKQQLKVNSQKITRKEELIAKTHFEEYNPTLAPSYAHTTVERTKSDPNSLANRSRIGLNSRRHVLMHQKSIDLTPADSSDEDYIYKQIPSAPPMCKTHGNFEIPKCFELTVANSNTTDSNLKPDSKTKEQRRFSNGKDDIPYILHKRHIMNAGNEKKSSKPKSPKSPKLTKTKSFKYEPTNNMPSSAVSDIHQDIYADVLNKLLPESSKDLFLKMDSQGLKTLEDHDAIIKQLDLTLLEKLNIKLSQIESDSATSSHTESLQQRKNKLEQRDIELVHSLRKELQMNNRKNSKPRIIPKPKISKPKKPKTRITSFSSDDESIDSDDVFGSAEAISHKQDFSPPQSRKEIEPILQIEQNRLISATWGRGQTMSSTEIEGSPPQCRRLAELESRYHAQKLDAPIIGNSTELRRISERSVSIPSSEDEHNLPARKIDVCTNDYQLTENIPSPIFEVAEFFRSNDDIYESYCNNQQLAGNNIDYTLTRKQLRQGEYSATTKSKFIQEVLDSSIIKRAKGHAPILFAHARLNLSEGSVTLQRQMATQNSLTSERRTKSLDAPVISLHKLPPMNAFSSKDDTVSFEEEAEILEEKSLERKKPEVHDDDAAESVQSCAGSIPTQSCFVVDNDNKDIYLYNSKLDEQEKELLNQLALIEKITLQSVKIKHKKKSKLRLKSGNHLILDIPNYGFTEWTPCNSATSSRKTSPGVSRAGSIENTFKDSSYRTTKSQGLRSRHDTRRTSADDIKTSDYKKKIAQKGRARSNENRKLSADKSKSQEETEADIIARKERQQKLYESAIKQTINMLSPVKDTLPPFPAPTDKISVITEGDKIIIETDFKTKAEDHVFIAKSPKKLDTSLVKFSRSFEERRSPDKLDKANRSFEDRNKSFEESESKGNSVDSTSDRQNIKHKLEGPVIYQNKLKDQTHSLDKLGEKQSVGKEHKKAKSLDEKKEIEAKKNVSTKNVVRSSTGDRRMFAHQFQTQEDIDMQAVISERRSLEIYKRSLPSEDTKESECNISRKPSTTESMDSYVSIDNSHSPVSKSPVPSHDSYPHRVPTIECEEASIEDDNSAEIHHLKVYRTDTTRLSLDRSRSDETGSWMTVECDEFVGSDTSDNEPRTLEPERFILEAQATLEDAGPLEYSNCVTPTSDLSKLVTPPNASPIAEKLVHELFQKQTSKEENSNLTKSDSGERELERQDWHLAVSANKERSSLDEESSVSCSIARPLGISQDFGDIEEKKCLELKKKIFKIELNSTARDNELTNDSKTVTKRLTTPVLEKQPQIDLDTCTEIPFEYNNDNKKDKTRENKEIESISIAKTQQQLGKVKSAGSDHGSQESKSSLDSKLSSSIDSKGSFETESSSGSMGGAHKIGESHGRGQKQPAWMPLGMENSSSNTDESWNNNECSGEYERREQVLMFAETANNESKDILSEVQKVTETCADDLSDFPASIGYPALTCGIGVNQSDIIGFSPTFSVGRTLSRISERSTASEKSSMEDDVSKASTHSASLRDESVALTDHHQSLSSDSRSNTNLAYISEADRRTSAEMPEIPCDSATGDKLSSIGSINDPKSPTVVKGRFSVTQIIEGQSGADRQTLMCLSNTGSQDSEDWPLPEIPFDHVPVKPVESLYGVPDLDKPVPRTFCWKLQDLQEKSIDIVMETDSQDNPCFSDDTETIILKPLAENYRSEIDYQMEQTVDFFQPMDESDAAYVHDSSACLSSSFNPGICLSSSFNASCSNLRKSKEKHPLRKELSFDSVIVSQPTRSPTTHSPTLENESFLNDDVFMPGTIKIQFPSGELSKHVQSSSTSNVCAEDIHTITGMGISSFTSRLSTSSCRKCSHSSHSEEETSSLGTDVEGTVRMGLQPKKCTHSSHSEDTSIGLSISEWSTGTNTVKQYANLSGSDSLSAVSGVKSEKSHQTKSSMSSINKSIESLNDQSGSFSNKFSVDNGSSEGFRYDILSNSETDKMSDTTSATKSDDTTQTLTEMVHSLSEWSTSSSRTIVGQTTSDAFALDIEQRRERRDNNELDERCRQTRNLVKNYYFDDKNDKMPKIHRPADINRRKMLSHTSSFELDATSTSERMESDLTGSHESNFMERLYSPSEKLSERYQSQDFSALQAKIERMQSAEQLCDTASGFLSRAQHASYNENKSTEPKIMQMRKNKIRQFSSNQEQVHTRSQELANVSKPLSKPTTSTAPAIVEQLVHEPQKTETPAHLTAVTVVKTEIDGHPVKPVRTKKRLRSTSSAAVANVLTNLEESSQKPNTENLARTHSTNSNSNLRKS